MSFAAALLLAGGAAASAPSQPVNEHVCGVPAAGRAGCFAIRHYQRRESGNAHKTRTEPVSYKATELQTAYGLTKAAAEKGAGTTVAVIDAYNDPNAYADLAEYRSSEGLPAIGQCSPQAIKGSTTSCLARVNEEGEAGPYPGNNTGWSEEISLDLDMISAVCPGCNILLVEANSNSLADLGAAVNTAAQFEPVAIGNSYGGSESLLEELLAVEYYEHPGIAITAATGDGGYGVEFPAAAASVIGVGGTSLNKSSGVYSETVWSGSGSGCSAYIPKPAWQSDTGCAMRTVGDVAADADPNTGVRVYDTFNEPGWMVFGGTSASTQIIAGVYGLTGSGASNASGLYRNGEALIGFGSPNPNLYDVTSGSNGSCAGRGRYVNTKLAYLCTGVVGYDGPTGMGTPRGIAGF